MRYKRQFEVGRSFGSTKTRLAGIFVKCPRRWTDTFECSFSHCSEAQNFKHLFLDLCPSEIAELFPSRL
jgi:hypothetical protein